MITAKQLKSGSWTCRVRVDLDYFHYLDFCSDVGQIPEPKKMSRLLAQTAHD